MRLKYYLRGLGLGIIFTCLMFMLFSGRTKDDKTEQAGINNMLEATESVSSDAAAKSSTDGQDGSDVQNGAESQDEADAQNNIDAQNDTSVQNNTDNQNPADTSGTTDTASTDTNDVQDEYVTLVIEQGDIARDVAESLYEDGIIDDVESFRKYLGETGVSRTLHAGEYNIKVGSTYDEIVELLK